MAAISLFWYTNMAAVMLRENTPHNYRDFLTLCTLVSLREIRRLQDRFYKRPEEIEH